MWSQSRGNCFSLILGRSRLPSSFGVKVGTVSLPFSSGDPVRSPTGVQQAGAGQPAPQALGGHQSWTWPPQGRPQLLRGSRQRGLSGRHPHTAAGTAAQPRAVRPHRCTCWHVPWTQFTFRTSWSLWVIFCRLETWDSLCVYSLCFNFPPLGLSALQNPVLLGFPPRVVETVSTVGCWSCRQSVSESHAFSCGRASFCPTERSGLRAGLSCVFSAPQTCFWVKRWRWAPQLIAVLQPWASSLSCPPWGVRTFLSSVKGLGSGRALALRGSGALRRGGRTCHFSKWRDSTAKMGPLLWWPWERLLRRPEDCGFWLFVLREEICKRALHLPGSSRLL